MKTPFEGDENKETPFNLMTPTVSPPPELRSRWPPRTGGGPRRVRAYEGGLREAIRAAPARSAVAAAEPNRAVAPQRPACVDGRARLRRPRRRRGRGGWAGSTPGGCRRP